MMVEQATMGMQAQAFYMDFKNYQDRQGRAFRHLLQMKKFVYFSRVFILFF